MSDFFEWQKREVGQQRQLIQGKKTLISCSTGRYQRFVILGFRTGCSGLVIGIKIIAEGISEPLGFNGCCLRIEKKLFQYLRIVWFTLYLPVLCCPLH